MRKLLITLLTAVFGVGSLLAVPARSGKGVRMKQPDGTYVTIHLHGDEYRHFNTTTDGYTVVKDRQGRYVYAELSDSLLVPTARQAHDAAERSAAESAYLAGVSKYLMPRKTEQAQRMQQANSRRSADVQARRKAGEYDYSKFRGLMILIEFVDGQFSRSDYRELIDSMVNQPGFAGYTDDDGYWQSYTGSVRDYFSDNSGGRFQPEFDVIGPVQVNYSMYGFGEKQQKANDIFNAALTAADSQVDYSRYDGDGDGMVDLVYFVTAGNGSNYDGNDSGLLWPHRSVVVNGRTWDYLQKDGVIIYDYASSTELSGYTVEPSTVKIDGIGTICHEFSHVLGLPDFYDTDYEDSGGESHHPGTWSLMAGGSYQNDSRTPVGYSLYERYFVGFMDEPQTIHLAGEYTLEPLATTEQGYRIDSSGGSEFFLLENRQQKAFKWDAYLPGNGLLVHRVDYSNSRVWDMNANSGNTVNVNPAHNYYQVVCANGPQRTGASWLDAFPNGGKHELHNETSPANLRTWAGRSTQWGLVNIQAEDGVITFDAVDTYILNELSLPETFTAWLGVSHRLEATATPSYALYSLAWSSADPSIAVVSNDGVVTGVSLGTTTITVTSDNGLIARCQVTVSEVQTKADIADFKRLLVGDEAHVRLTDAQVVYKNGNDYYVRDASGAFIVRSTAFDVEVGDVLNGVYYGKCGDENGLTILTDVDGMTSMNDLAVTSDVELLPREVAIERLSPTDYADYVTITGVQLERDGGVFGFAETTNTRFRLWNKFNIKKPEIKVPSDIDGKLFSVTGIYGTDVKDGIQINEIYLLKSPQETGTVAISAVKADDVETPVYNLHGQRVNDRFSGLMISGGRKVLRR